MTKDKKYASRRKDKGLNGTMDKKLTYRILAVRLKISKDRNLADRTMNRRDMDLKSTKCLTKMMIRRTKMLRT